MTLRTLLKITPFSCRTNGLGLWSQVARSTKVLEVTALSYSSEVDPDNFGSVAAFGSFEIRVTGWDFEDGLIYGDDLWITDFKEQMEKQGFIVGTIDFTEQGMQGDCDLENDEGCLVSLEGVMLDPRGAR